MKKKYILKKFCNSVLSNLNLILLFFLLGFSISSSAQCDPPTNFRITGRTPDFVTIEWDPPANSSSVDGYDYNYDTVNQPNFSWPYFTNTPSITIYGLPQGDVIYLDVRTSCSNNSSTPVGPFIFSTLLPNQGCQLDTYGLYPTETFTPTFSSTPDVIATDSYAGHYSKVNIISNREYIFNSSVATDYITITDEDGSPILAHGPAPLTWISPSPNNYSVINYYTSANASCDEEDIARIKTIKGQGISGCNNPFTEVYPTSIQSTSAVLNWNISLANVQYFISTDSTTPTVNQTPSGNNNDPDSDTNLFQIRTTGLLPNTTYHFWIRRVCDNTNNLWGEWFPGGSFTTQAAEYIGCFTGNNFGLGQDLSSTYIPGCFGNQEIISTSCYAGEYNVVQIQKNKIYTFYSSVTTDHISLISPNGWLIASGTTPLVWSSGDNSGNCKFLIKTSINCGVELNSRTQSIKCKNANLSCDAPNAFAINAITNSTANLSFVGANHIPSNGYQYYLSTSTTEPTSTTTATGSTLITNLFLSNLNANTTYYIWIRSNCGTSKSDWVFGNNFTTVGSSPAGCISSQNGMLPSTTFTPSCFGNTETILTNASTNQYSKVTLTANTQYTFTSNLTGNQNAPSDYITITNEDASQVYIVGTSPLVWNSGTNTGIMRYYIHSNFACGSDGNNRIKAISCTPTPNCNTPSSLVSSTITSNGATLTWAAPNPIPSNGYYYYVSTTNTAPNTSTAPSGFASGTSIVLNSLNPNTTYYFWVQSNCGATQSNWSNSISFITLNSAPTGCTTAPYGLFPSTTFTPNCSGTAEIIASNAYAGEYSNVTIIANKQYTFSSSIATDFITITNADASVIYASGTTPLVWNSGTNAGLIRYFIHTNSACDSAEIIRTKSIQCQDVVATCIPPSNLMVSNVLPTEALLSWTAASPAPPVGYDIYLSTTNSITAATIPTGTVTGLNGQLTNLSPDTTYYFWVRSNCGGSDVSEWIAGPNFSTTNSSGSGCVVAPYGLYPSFNFTLVCLGTNETIVTDAYAGEYSNVNIITDKLYTFSSSVATDFITITNQDASITYASGTSPLMWDSETNSGVIRYYLHTNACGSEEINRIKYIKCQFPCNPPSNLTVSNILPTEAFLSWNAASPIPSVGYDVYLSTTNTITTATIPTGTVSGLNGQLTNLNSATTYYFWVRSNCGSSNVSEWIAGPSFTTTTPSGTGCISAPYGLYPITTFTPACTGTNETIVMDAYGGEYSNVNIVSNKQYTFTSSVATDYITITNADASIIYVSGTTPLIWNSGTNAGVIRYYFHTNSACGSADVERIKSIQCQNEATPCNPPSNLTVSNLLSNGALLNWTAATPGPSVGYDVYFSTTNSITTATIPTGTVTALNSQLTNLNSATTYYFWVRSNCGGSDVSEWIAGPSFTTTASSSGCTEAIYGLYPTATFTPLCTGTNETIVTDAYAGEYSNVNIIANKQYTFTSSLATDFITITNADASIIYASGTTPLIWNSETISGVIKYYFHTNSACGTSNTNRTKFIQCQDVVIPCNPPSNLTVSNVLSTEALLQWSAASSVPSGGYEIYFSTINSISAATIPSLFFVTLSGQLNNLNPSTTYYIWIRSNCDDSGVSDWIAGPSFTTTTPSGSGCLVAPYGLYPPTVFTPACTETNETIVEDAYAGEYSNITIISDRVYTFDSSIATDFITITNADASIIYASGTAPLVWNSETNSGTMRYYFHTDSDCGVSNSNRTKIIKCTTTLDNPSFEKSFAKIYPNPTKDIITVEAERAIDKIIITNSLGQEIEEVITNVSQVRIDLSTYASGVYFVKIYQESATQTSKIVKN